MDRESPWKELRERSRPPAVRLPIIAIVMGLILSRIVSKIRSNKLHVTVEIISKVWYRYLNESNTLMRYFDVKLEKKYITIVIVDETRKLERKLWRYRRMSWRLFRNRKYISIRVWKLRKEISEIEEHMNLDTDVQGCIENFWNMKEWKFWNFNNEDLEITACLNLVSNDFAISPITNHRCDYAVTFQAAVQEELPGAVDSRKLVPPRCVLWTLLCNSICIM